MSLVWNYKLTDVATSVVDSEGLVADATNVGTVVSFTDPTYGEVAQFSGSNNLEIASAPTEITGTVSRAISVWLQQTSQGSNTRMIFSYGTDAGQGQRFRLQVDNAGKLGYDVFNVEEVGTATATVGTWFHCVLMYDLPTTTITLYVDGVSVASTVTTLDTSAGAFAIGTDPVNALPNFVGYVSDFRAYNDVLTPADITTLFADGPNVATLELTLYTHIADLTWSAIDGATTYTIRKTESGGLDEIDVVVDTTELSYTDYNLMAATAYVYNLYTDVSPTIVVLTELGTTPVVDSTSVGLLLTRVSNDITILTVNAAEAIESTLRDVLGTGDALETTSGSVTFVENLGTLALPFGSVEKVLLPFDTGFVGTQGATITLPDLTDEVLGYDEGADEVIYDTVNYAIGEYFKSGTYKVSVKDL